jgi:hypothetical protein
MGALRHGDIWLVGGDLDYDNDNDKKNDLCEDAAPLNNLVQTGRLRDTNHAPGNA